MTAMTLAIASAFAIAAQADGRAVPDAGAVRGALEEYFNRGCGDGEGLCNHPVFVGVRRLACAPAANGRARCRFEERQEQLYIRHPRWRRVQYPFVYDAPRGRWILDCREETVLSNGPVTLVETRCN